MNLLASASQEMIGHLELHSQDATKVRRIVAELGGERTGARMAQFEALLWLIDAQPVEDSARLSREQAVTRGFESLDGALTRYVRAEGLILALLATCELDCFKGNNALSYLSEARALLESFDRTLPYTAPERSASLIRPVEYRNLMQALVSTDMYLLRAWNDSNLSTGARRAQTDKRTARYAQMLWRVAWAFGLVVGAEHPSITPDVDTLTRQNPSEGRVHAQMGVAERILSDISVMTDMSGRAYVLGLPAFYASICLDRSRLLVEPMFSREVRTIGMELTHLCEAWASSNGAAWGASQLTSASGYRTAPAETVAEPAPSLGASAPAQSVPAPAPSAALPAATSGDVYARLAENLPAPGEFRLLPGSAIGDVLVGKTEFPFCSDIKCFSAKNAFLAWVGMAFDEANGYWWNLAGGGHADYGGNEVYRFDFSQLSWTRRIDPQPLTGRFLTDTDGDSVNDSCPAPQSGPPSTHSYDGQIYVPVTNEVVLASTGAFCLGAMAKGNGLWVWVPSSRTWKHFPEIEDTKYMRTAWDPARQRIYMLGGSSKSKFYELDPLNDYELVRSGPGFGWLGEGTATFDSASRSLYFTGSGQTAGFYRVTIDEAGNLGDKELLFAWTEIGGVRPLAFDIHEPTGQVVFWNGDTGLYRYDPRTDTVRTLTAPDGPANAKARVYSKWVYINAVDAFVGIDDPRTGVWAYRLSQSDDPPRPEDPARPGPPPPGPAGNFGERCNAAGVVFCDPLDTEGPWGVDGTGARRLMPNPDGTTGLPTETWWRNWRGTYNRWPAREAPGHVVPRLDTEVKASGSGSLKFVYPTLSAQHGAGSFATNFSDDLSQTFGEGDTFYVQFRWRANCDFMYFDCEPTSPTYKTARRYFRSTGGGLTAFKSTIIADGDPSLGESADACTFLQIVTNHGPDHYLAAYHSCGWYSGFYEKTGESLFGSTQFDFQPNGTVLGTNDDQSPTCWWIPDATTPGKRTWGSTGPDCWYLDSDEWITVQIMVRIGRWQTDRTGPKTSHVTIWGAHEDEPQRVIIDHDLYLHAPKNPDSEYGKIWLLPFMTNKDPEEEHPTGFVWYDELIVSDRFIADPK